MTNKSSEIKKHRVTPINVSLELVWYIELQVQKLITRNYASNR